MKKGEDLFEVFQGFFDALERGSQRQQPRFPLHQRLPVGLAEARLPEPPAEVSVLLHEPLEMPPNGLVLVQVPQVAVTEALRCGRAPEVRRRPPSTSAATQRAQPRPAADKHVTRHGQQCAQKTVKLSKAAAASQASLTTDRMLLRGSKTPKK